MIYGQCRTTETVKESSKFGPQHSIAHSKRYNIYSTHTSTFLLLCTQISSEISSQPVLVYFLLGAYLY